MELKPDQFIIDEIFQIKKMKAQKKFQTERPVIIITTDLFLIIPSDLLSDKISIIISEKKFLEAIRFSEILDIKFPNLDRALDKLRDKSKGVPFKIITNHEDYVVYVTEGSFMRTRDFLRLVTQKKEEVR